MIKQNLNLKTEHTYSVFLLNGSSLSLFEHLSIGHISPPEVALPQEVLVDYGLVLGTVWVQLGEVV